MKRALVVAAVAVLAIGAFFLARRGPQVSDEDRVREAVEEARQAVEAGDLRRFMACISSRYDDGNHTRETLHSMMAFGLRQYATVQVTVYVRDVEVNGDTATAVLDVQATGSHQSGDSAHFDGPMRVRLARESVRRHLVLKADRWRALGIDNFGDVQDAFTH